MIKKLPHYTLNHLKHILELNDELKAQNYISQNLAVARNVQGGVLRNFLPSEPIVLCEMRVILFLRGSVTVTANMIERHFRPGDLLFLGPEGIVQFKHISEDAQGMGISINDDLLSMAVGNDIPDAFNGHIRDFQIHLAEDEIARLDALHGILYRIVHAPEYSPQSVMHLIGAFLWQVNYLWERHESVIKHAQSKEQQLFGNFIKLVNEHSPHEHNIGFYAERLCLSARYMSTLVKSVSGKAAKQWIDDALAMRIKADLLHSDKPVWQISEEMNFPNPSFFTKFFRRMTGLTPQQYRKIKTSKDS